MNGLSSELWSYVKSQDGLPGHGLHVPKTPYSLLNDFKFGTFISHFPSVGAACMAVKGLTILLLFGLA